MNLLIFIRYECVVFFYISSLPSKVWVEPLDPDSHVIQLVFLLLVGQFSILTTVFLLVFGGGEGTTKIHILCFQNMFVSLYSQNIFIP